MGRPSKLTPAQWEEIDRRLVAGEGVRALAGEFGVSPATVSKRGVSKQSKQVAAVAKQVAAAQTALAELPVAQQYTALSLAAKLRSISDNLASAADLGAKTAHRLNALANTEVAKIDDAEPLKSGDSLKGVMVLTRLANESASIALNLMAANKETVQRINTDPPKEPAIDATVLTDGTLQELLAARAPAAH